MRRYITNLSGAAWGTRILVLFVYGLSIGYEAVADWPGLLGPRRDGHAAPGTTLRDKVPKQLAPIWQIPAGQGYAGAAISDSHAVLYQRDANEDVLRRVDLRDGQVQWRTAFPANYRQGIDEDKGPRSVPQIIDDRIVIQSASGSVHCVSLADGKVLWSRDLRKEYGADDGYFGAGNTPLVTGGVVIVNVGGKKKNAGIVAASLLDGSTFWTATDADAGYASPIIYSPLGDGNADSQIAVVPTRLTTYGIDTKSGQVRWEFPFGQRGPTVNAATPIVLNGGRVLQTASYGIGYVSAEIGQDRVQIVRKGDELASQYATPVAIGTLVFASDGREDGGFSTYKCLQPDTGKMLWEKTGMPVSHTIAIDANNDRKIPILLIAGVDGSLWLIPASEKGFQPLWQTQLPSGKYRALPALSGNKLLVRTCLTPDAKWMCFDL